jgi:hypothetical protein
MASVSGHPAMEVAIEVRGRLVLGVPVFALGGVWPILSFLLLFCLLLFLSEDD